MLKSLSIKNFQSWKDAQFDFHPGVNVIIGFSDAGKSAIIRALRWLIWNRPLGSEFQSNWGGETVVDLTTTEGVTISRSQDKNGNEKTYTLSTFDKPLKAFGTDVPKEVSDVLSINDINLHQQQDSFFLLKDTSGDVAAHFNKIANLEKIGIAQSNVKKWIGEITSEIGHEETKDRPATGLIKSIKEKKQELLKYDHLETFESKVKVLEDLESKLNLEHKNKQELQNIVDNIIELRSEIKQEKEILKIEPTLIQVFNLIEKRNAETKDLNALIKLVCIIEESKTEIEELKSIISADTIIDNLIQLYQKKDKEEKEHYQLNKLVVNINNGKKLVKMAEQEYNRLHKEFEKEFPDICPLCNKPK
jgi:exonuclease SbcC